MRRKIYTHLDLGSSELQREGKPLRAKKQTQQEKMADLAAGLRKCRKCLMVKPLSNFKTTHRYKDSFLSRCNECESAYQKEYREKMSIDIQWVLKERKRKRECIRRNWDNRNPEKLQAAKKKWRLNNLDKSSAQKKVYDAIEHGKLVALPCIKCGAKAQAHHDDYSKPLDVVWLCPKHHSERHVQLREHELLQSTQPATPTQ